MASITKYRNKWLKYHKGYEKYAYRLLRSTFKKWNEAVINTGFNENTIYTQLSNVVKFEEMYSTYNDIYYNIGKTHGARVGKDINLELKAFTMEAFMQLFERDLPMYLQSYGITRIQQVHQSYLEEIFKLFNDRILAGKTLKETTEEVFKIMRAPRFYKWQAERIARTETTGAANYSAIKSGDVSGFVMQKHWISAVDPRTRTHLNGDFDHREMNGVKVGLKENFIFNKGGLDMDELEYPGDPKGRAGNVINCRCTVGIIPARDKNGSLIRTN